MNADALRTVTPEEVKVGMRIRRVWKGPRVAHVERLGYGAPDTKVTRYTTDEQDFELTVAHLSPTYWALDSEDAGVPLRGNYTIEVLAEAPPAYETVDVPVADLKPGDEMTFGGMRVTVRNRWPALRHWLDPEQTVVQIEYPVEGNAAQLVNLPLDNTTILTVQRCVSS